MSINKESKNHFQKLILTFQHYQTLSQRIFLSGYRSPKCQARKKGLCPMSPIGKPIMTFKLPQKKTRIKVISGFRGITPRLPVRLETCLCVNETKILLLRVLT
jgi:hypothetical protein